MKRNLIYHLYPKKESIWPWHVWQLLKYKEAWNGRRLVTLAMDSDTDDLEPILEMLKPLEAEIFVEKNSKGAGETAFFLDRLKLLYSRRE
jgi:hypothetical protein